MTERVVEHFMRIKFALLSKLQRESRPLKGFLRIRPMKFTHEWLR